MDEDLEVGADQPRGDKADEILRTVMDLIVTEGYDAVQLRTIAQRAHMSVRTIYTCFATREDIILAAVTRWMEQNAYWGLADPPDALSLYDELMWGIRAVFEPWERSPHMLEAFHYICVEPGGDRLRERAFAAFDPAAQHLQQEYDEAFAADVSLIILHVSQAAIASFVAGEIGVDGILPIIERTVRRLTADNTSATLRKGA